MELLGIPVGEGRRYARRLLALWCPVHDTGINDANECHVVQDLTNLRKKYQDEVGEQAQQGRAMSVASSGTTLEHAPLARAPGAQSGGQGPLSLGEGLEARQDRHRRRLIAINMVETSQTGRRRAYLSVAHCIVKKNFLSFSI